MPQPKIATCCYCGTRAALVLSGRIQHELACASCGAPLHDLKAMPVSRGTGRQPVSRGTARQPVSRGTARQPDARGPTRPAKPLKRKKRRKKSLGKRLLGEALDVIEDIFD